MLLRNKVAALILQEKMGKDIMKLPDPPDAPDAPEPIKPKLDKIKFKASPYTEPPHAPRVDRKDQVDVTPQSGPTANQNAAALPVPTPTYNPVLQDPNMVGSLLPPMPAKMARLLRRRS